MPRRFPVVQWPNPPLWIALAAGIAARLTSGTVRRDAALTFRLAMIVWAYDELARGSNWFRRVLGAGVLARVVLELRQRLHR